MNEGRYSGGIWQSVLVALFVLVGVVARAAVMVLPVGVIDSDGAIVGLMALHPTDLPVFYWGQAYGGSLEAVLASGLFAVLPDTAFVLKLVPVGLSFGAAFLIWRIGLRAVGSRAAGLAALAFLVWPAAFLWWSTKVGTYWGALCCGLVAVLLLLQLRDERTWSVPRTLLFGLSIGVAFWLNTQTLYLILPACAMVIPDGLRNWRRLPLAAGAALVGASPWIGFNLRNDFLSLEWPPHPVTSYGHRLGVFFDHLLPMALGLQIPFSRRWLPLGHAIAVAMMAMLAVASVYILLRVPRARPLAAVVVAYPFLYAISPLSWYPDQPRYLLFLMPVLCLVAAWTVMSSRRVPSAVAFVLLAGLIALDVPALRDMNERRSPSPYAPDVLVPVDFSDLRALLEEEDIRYGFADYWISYRATFEMGEDTILTPFNGTVRSAEYDRAVRARPLPPYVFVAESRTDEAFTALLGGRGISVERRERGKFAVLTPSAKVLPEQVGAVLQG